MNLIIYRFSKI